ncbi:site-specific integrase [Candidatus Solirubrobacter pratensis]|uniref:site-specific integrase n=1 Tax=Candidatus Solirubrobacter pratensis TaxID=1298857 RepID=UPI000415FA9E|nr:site-specific integrase [Candidatus Solirubrobacter pratensis]
MKTPDGRRGERYRVLFRHRGEEKLAGTFDDLDLALAEKARAERAKRDGRLDEYAAGLLEGSDADLTLWEFMRLWFTEDAAPHLAEATLKNYLQVANKWIRPIAGTWPLRAFEKPRAVNELLRHAQLRGVARLDAAGRSTGDIDTARPPTADRVRKILSSALTWGVEHRGDLIAANGCKLVTTRRRRRSGRLHVASPSNRPERALTAEAAEHIARALLARTEQRTWEPHRDAILLRCLFALGMRPEEVAAARWQALMKPTVEGDWMLAIEDALSHGRIAGVKTIERSKRVPGIVYQWLTAWRQVAASYGLAVEDCDFIIPGVGDGHFSLNQHKKWGAKYFRPAAKSVAQGHPKLAHLTGATPYSARRGHITCRILAGEPVEVIARSCGTSPATIYRHYFVAIDAAESGHRLAPFEQQLAEAVALVDRRPPASR